MDVEHILCTLNQHGVDYVLIGGMNFLLNHGGPVTFDVDVFVRDTEQNRLELNFALNELSCEWGLSADDWKPIPTDAKWLEAQKVFCLTSPHGALDVFRAVQGLDDGYEACKARAELRAMRDGEIYFSLCDHDMLRCQLALPEPDRKKERVYILQKIVEKKNSDA